MGDQRHAAQTTRNSKEDEINPFDTLDVAADFHGNGVGFARLAVEARGVWSQTCLAQRCPIPGRFPVRAK